jgi:hypothetical protein
MVKKRTSLASLLDEGPGATAPEPVRPRQSVEIPSGQGRRTHVKQQTVYLPLPVYEQLRRLAFEERSKMHTILMEGLDRVFKDRGLSSIEDLRAGQDS